MSTVIRRDEGGPGDPSQRVALLERLQHLANRIHSTDNIGQIMTELAHDICHLFGADRLTLYAVNPSHTAIESRIKTGLDTIRDITLPIDHSSVAGHVALTRQMVNIANVYDRDELLGHSPDLQFLEKIDQRSGYRSCEMIVAPILHEHSGELLGVLQLINNRAGGRFTALVEDGVRELCQTLAVAFAWRMKPGMPGTADGDGSPADADLLARLRGIVGAALAREAPELGASVAEGRCHVLHAVDDGRPAQVVLTIDLPAPGS